MSDPPLVRSVNFWHKIFMTSTSEKRGRGRPPVGSTSVNVRLTPEQLAALDAHIARLKEPVGRPEAIRRLIEKGLGKR
jgi:hypothetical protein